MAFTLHVNGVIPLVCTHEGGGESSKSVRHAYRGRALDTSKYEHTKSLCAHLLICKVLLPYFVAFGVDFHCCFIKHLP